MRFERVLTPRVARRQIERVQLEETYSLLKTETQREFCRG